MKNNKHVKMLFLGGNYLKLILTLFVCVLSANLSAQENLVSGKVTDNTAMPLPGVNVHVKGSTKGTQTDFDGNFSINVPSKGILVFSFIGMDEVSVETENKKNLKVVL